MQTRILCYCRCVSITARQNTYVQLDTDPDRLKVNVCSEFL